jgi:glycosyltransferase involved in cell wall biosynthesis
MQKEDLSVCFVVTKLTGGGAERAMTLLASQFGSARVRTAIISIGGATPDDYPLSSAVQAVRLGRRKVSGALLGLAFRVRRLRPTWLVSASLNTDLALLALRPLLALPVKILCSLQNNLSAVVEAERARGRGLPVRQGLKLYRSADLLTAISRGVAEDAARLLGARSGTDATVPNPLDLGAIDALRIEPPDPEIAVPTDGPWILAAGRLSPQKDFATLLTALSLVRRQRPDARLTILGEGPDRARLEGLAKELGVQDIVRFPGFVRNPFAAMARARVFVLSSRYEGFGNVVAEALACGTEVVSTDCPYGPGEILDGGRLGWLVPVEDPRTMADAILEALHRKRNHPTVVRAWLHRFSLPEVAGAYLQLMRAHRTCV